jgi:hypothetical protein
MQASKVGQSSVRATQSDTSLLLLLLLPLLVWDSALPAGAASAAVSAAASAAVSAAGFATTAPPCSSTVCWLVQVLPEAISNDFVMHASACSPSSHVPSFAGAGAAFCLAMSVRIAVARGSHPATTTDN